MTETADKPAQQEENPLAAGLALRKTPDPCALVIFGASGDLTHKKLMPALYALAVRRLLPPRFAIVGVARTGDVDDASYRKDMEKAVKQHARDPFRQDIWDELAPRLHYVSTDFADAGGEDKVHDLLEKLDEEEQLGGNRVFYLAVPPPAFPTIVEALGKRRGDRRLDAARRREAVRPRPRVGEAADRDAVRVLQRGRDLPDRPLPGQGDGPEHARAPLRERDLRADLEPPVRRPRPDHGRRVDRDRGARRLLRARGRDPRHLPEPPAAAARADGDGAADRLHLRLGAQREGEGAARAAHARAAVGRARPVRTRLRRRRGGRRATARRRASRPTR